MKLRRTTTEAWGILRTVTCILVAVLIFLISFPSFAAEESSTEVVPDTEAAISEDEITEEKSEEIIEESKEENVQEESAETAGKNEEDTGAKDVQTGYVTMKAVSGNTSITN